MSALRPSRRGGPSTADLIRQAVAARGLSGAELARAAGVHPATVTRFLAGASGLTLDSFDAIAAALGLRLVETGRRLGRRPVPVPPPARPAPPEADRAATSTVLVRAGDQPPAGEGVDPLPLAAEPSAAPSN
jgi:transcriptional regulator with XRE-family HTH domain